MKKKFDWKTIAVSVKIPKNSYIGKLFIKKIRESKECIIHAMNYDIFSKPYKKYRRGKNRCERCGLKI